MPDSRPDPVPERIVGRISWESYSLRAEKRIRANMDLVLDLCSRYDLSLVDVAKIPGAPGLRTMRRWASENLYDFGKRYKQTRREQWTMRYLDQIKTADREQAALSGPKALALYDRMQELIFLKAFQDALEDEEDTRFTPQQRGILNLCLQGWSFNRIADYCDRFGVDLEAPEES
ncbi:MAG: hypothetical protein ABSF77_05280 [Spirochaetia bacterium]